MAHVGKEIRLHMGRTFQFYIGPVHKILMVRHLRQDVCNRMQKLGGIVYLLLLNDIYPARCLHVLLFVHANLRRYFLYLRKIGRLRQHLTANEASYHLIFRHNRGGKIHQPRMAEINDRLPALQRQLRSLAVAFLAACAAHFGTPGILHAEIREIAAHRDLRTVCLCGKRRHPAHVSKTLLYLLQNLAVNQICQFQFLIIYIHKSVPLPHHDADLLYMI